MPLPCITSAYIPIHISSSVFYRTMKLSAYQEILEQVAWEQPLVEDSKHLNNLSNKTFFRIFRVLSFSLELLIITKIKVIHKQNT